MTDAERAEALCEVLGDISTMCEDKNLRLVGAAVAPEVLRSTIDRVWRRALAAYREHGPAPTASHLPPLDADGHYSTCHRGRDGAPCLCASLDAAPTTSPLLGT
jgi:hypothetical protein